MLSYRIQYGNYPQYKTKANLTLKKRMPLIISAVAVVMILIFIVVPQIKAGLLDLLLPGDASVSGNAITAFAEDLKAGVSVGEAITEFCRFVIQNAEIS